MSNKLPIWRHIVTQQAFKDINAFCDGAIGFIYLIEFDDHTYYLGKKNLYSTRTVKHTDKEIKGTLLNIKYKNSGKGFRQRYDIIQTESNWKTYKGSSKEVKGRVPIARYILSVAYSKLQLTYLEDKYLFMYDAIIDPNFLNANIGGKFYRGSIPPEASDDT